LYKYFEDQVFRLPENEECIWSRDGVYTWRQTYDMTHRYAQFLLSHGVQKGELVGFYLTNSAEFGFAWLGSWAIGTAPAMINYHLAGEALVHCVKLANTKVLLVDWDDECIARIEASRKELEDMGIKIIILDAATKAHIAGIDPVRPPNTFRDAVAPTFPMALIYTSGSTGFPKAVPFSCGRLIPFAAKKTSAIGIKSGPDGDRYYTCMPLYHGTAGVVFVGCMLSGVTCCIGKKFSSTRFWDDIIDSDSTAFVYVGEAARYLLAQPPSPKDTQHRVRLMFGNGLRPDVWKRFQDRFGVDTVAEFFNSSEGVFGTLNIARGPYLQKAVGHHGAILRAWYRNYFASAEVDLDTGELKRDSKTGFGIRTPLKEGGEIIVQVPDESLFPGYWRNPNATNKKFIRNLFKKGDLWYRTGDALRRTDDGHWYFMDRYVSYRSSFIN
jgi:acyl-CoA synthetase (AMP-forming)/AMP-acid ligase II